MCGQSGRKAAQHIGGDVRKRDIRHYLALANQVGALYRALIRHAVELAVVRRAVGRDGVDIGEICALRTQKDGRYAQNTASATHVEAHAFGR